MSALPSSSIERLRRSHELLHTLIVDAEEMLHDPPDVDDMPWMRSVAEKMLTSLHDEFQLKERGKYLEDVLEEYPAWEPQMLRLKEEHRLLEGRLRELCRRLEQEPQEALTKDWRDDFREWLKDLNAHEHREATLVQEGFGLDVGQGE